MKTHFRNAWGYQGDNMNLPVAIAEDAAVFYEKIMGFRVAERLDDPVPKIVLARDDVQIALAENGGDHRRAGRTLLLDRRKTELTSSHS